MVRDILLFLILVLSCALTTTSASSLCHTSANYDALVAFFSATNGTHWKNRSGWGDPGVDVSQWYGVVCTANGDVTSLNLAKNDLGGTLPQGSVVTALSNLATLDVSGVNLAYNPLNQIHGTLPKDWGTTLTALQVVQLRDNFVQGELPKEWSGLSSLRTLNVAFNQIDGTLPAEWGGSLLRMEGVWLDFNPALSGSIPDSWGQMTQMVTLSISQTNLSGSLPAALSSWSQITYIALNDGGLIGTLPSAWGGMTRLLLLSLSSNSLTGTIPPSWWVSWPNILQLKLDHNCLEGTIPNVWGRLPVPSGDLILDHNSLSGTLPSLPLGKMITLSNNALSGTLPSSWSVVHTLHLNSNQLSGLLPATWYGVYATVFELDLSYNDFYGSVPSSWGSKGSVATNTSWTTLLKLSFNPRLTGFLPETWNTFHNSRLVIDVCAGNAGLCPSSRLPFQLDSACSRIGRNRLLPSYCRSKSTSLTVTHSESQRRSNSESKTIRVTTTASRVIKKRYTTGIAQPLATGALVMVSLLTTPAAIGAFPSLLRCTTTRLRLLDCDSSIDDPPNVYECPLAFTAGAGPGSVLRGSVAGSVVLLCVCAVPALLVAVLPERLRVVRLGARWVNLPSVFVVPFFVVGQPLLSRLALLARARVRSNAGDYAMYIVGYGLCGATVAWIAWVVCRRAEHFAAVAEPQKKREQTGRNHVSLQWFVSDSCEWQARRSPVAKGRGAPPSLFVEKHACLFEDFRAGRHWCMMVELCGLLAGAIIDSLQPISTPFDDPAAEPIQDVVLTCRGALIATAALECAVLAALGVLRPERRPVDVAATLLFHTLASVTAVLAVLMDADTSAAVASLVAWVSFGQSTLVMTVVGLVSTGPHVLAAIRSWMMSSASAGESRIIANVAAGSQQPKKNELQTEQLAILVELACSRCTAQTVKL